MVTKAAGAITADVHEAMEEGGATTEVADWVIRRNLSPQAFLLYVRMCYLAKDADFKGIELIIEMQELDTFARGDGEAALAELLELKAVTKVGRTEGRYRIEVYPPKVRALMAQHLQVGGQPIVTYG